MIFNFKQLHLSKQTVFLYFCALHVFSSVENPPSTIIITDGWFGKMYINYKH